MALAWLSVNPNPFYSLPPISHWIMINGETSLLQILVEARHLLPFTSLSISGDSFWAVAIFITSFRCPCVRRLRTFDLLIFITEKACSHKYVVPNIQSILPAKAVSIGYCGHRYIWLWWQGLRKLFDCNRCVVIRAVNRLKKINWLIAHFEIH